MIDKLVDSRSTDKLRNRNQYAELIFQVVRERDRPQRIQPDFIQGPIRIDGIYKAELRHYALLQSAQKFSACSVIHMDNHRSGLTVCPHRFGRSFAPVQELRQKRRVADLSGVSWPISNRDRNLIHIVVHQPVKALHREIGRNKFDAKR